MKTSERGLIFIEKEEGKAKWEPGIQRYFRYRDQIGKWTIGVGHLCRAGEEFPEGITEERVRQLLATDVFKCDTAIDEIKWPRPATQNEHDALSSWLFNVGIGWASAERSSVVRAIEAGRFHDVPNLLLQYDVAGGQHQSFLRNRRQREGTLYVLEGALFTAPADTTPTWEELSAKCFGLNFGRLDLLSEKDLG